MNMRAKQKFSLKWTGPTLIVAAVLTIIAALVLVLGVRAIASADFSGNHKLIHVPGDHPTIQGAIDASEPGDVIQVKAGLYRENITLNKAVSLVAESFDEANPTNNKTIIDGGGTGTTVTIPAGLTPMPTIRGFVIQNGLDNIQAASEFVLEFNFIHTANYMVSYQAGGGGFNRGNIYFNAGDNAIRLDHTDRPVVIESNRILHSVNSGIEISLESVAAPLAVVEIDIWNNMILGNGEDGIQLIDHPGDPQNTNRRVVIAGNLIANNQKAGLGLMGNANTLEDYSGAGIVESVRVINNTFYGNDYGISGGDNLVAINNIIANSSTRGIWRVPGTEGGISTVAYSLFFNNGIDAEETSLGPGIIQGQDPRFEAGPNAGPDGTWGTVDDDFSGLVLRADSPAIDKGVTQVKTFTGELVPPTPLTGFAGAAPDLGWREFGAPLFMTPTSTLLTSPTASFTPLPATSTPLPSATSPIRSSTPLPMKNTPTSSAPLPTVTSTLASGPTSTSPTAATTSTGTAQLTIQSIDPSSAQADTTLEVTILGSGFQDGAVVTFEGGTGLAQEVLSVEFVDSTTILVTLMPRNDGTSGTQVWDIRVTNPDNSTAVLPDAFTVVPAP
jgi:IPT/TIG domain-containing protein